MSRILVGITGSIAAYKACELVRQLRLKGHKVTVVMTEAAQAFITPITFESLTGNPVYTDLFQSGRMLHIDLERNHEALLVAPVTADFIGKLAAGLADDLLSCLLLCKTKTAFLAPAMNPEMYQNPIVLENIQKLKQRGFYVLPVEEGLAACGEIGPGKLLNIDRIVGEIEAFLTPKTLAGMQLLVTAGPTREPLDEVRFLSNPSTGKMGYVIAEEAAHRGAEVHLITGPTQLSPPWNVQVERVNTAKEMWDACFHHWNRVDAVVMAAAVSDFSPANPKSGKPPKTTYGKTFQLTLAQTPDILQEMGRRKKNHILVGFSAQWGLSRKSDFYQQKFSQKNLDLLVVNDVSTPDTGFASDTNRVLFITGQRKTQAFPLLSKSEVATEILNFLASLWKKRRMKK